MKTIFYIALAIHIIAILGILGLLLSQIAKSPRKLSPGVIHAGLTALVAGIVMVGLYAEAKPDEVLDHMKVGVKTVVLTAILLLGYKNVKKAELKSSVWGSMLALTVVNIIIAVGW
ncbi:MAG: hypothetical protein F2602_03425 [Actinobacteria bacterium]|uniref:Unannotated protein n=1 Tax=freshwater metagenome TaxID=449393 RepID=A0A6J6BSU3_9ZZZZ|nr:hypothetical protein [Actinomycetota bacterium]MTA21177.1 hypothetical protein [Actinomycetota bacterium]